MNGGEVIAAVLAAGGVERCYTVPGESFLELLDAVEQRRDLRLVSTRHESGAAFMADADAKLTGRPAAVFGSRGPGAANLAIGVHTARQDSTPMLVVLGQVPTAHLGREAFQEVDLAAMFAPLAKASLRVARADRLGLAVAEGLRLARHGRPGPVVLEVPADLFGGALDSSDMPGALDSSAMPGASGQAPAPGAGAAGAAAGAPGGTAAGASGGAALPGLAAELGAQGPDPRQAQLIASALVAAARPVCIVGAGARWARDDVVALAEAFQLGVYTAFRRQDAFPNDHPLYLGHLGLGCSEGVRAALEAADLVLVLGSRLSEVTTQEWTLPRPAARVVQVDLDPGVLGASHALELGVVADVGATARALVVAAGRHGTGGRDERVATPLPDAGSAGARDWSAAHAAYLADAALPDRRASGRAAGGAGEDAGVHPAAVIGALAATAPEGVVVANDAGNFAAFLHRYWRYCDPLSQLAPTSGAMGYGVPAAVAACLAAPGRPVLALAGDGGVLMTGNELETATRLGLAPVVVVMRNSLYGTIATHQLRSFGRTAAVDISAVDLATWARGLGAVSFSVGSEDALEKTFAAAFAEAESGSRPVLVDVATDPDVLSPTVRASALGRARHPDGA